MSKFNTLCKKILNEEEFSSTISSEMKDMSDYVVRQGNKFYVDVYDVDSGEPLWEDGEVFTFTYEGKTYRGTAEDEGDETAEVLLAP
jgi:predicted heme/steroid binding protein